MTTDRREFMIQSAGALAGVALLPGLEGLARSIEEGYPVGIIGTGRQGRAIAAELQKIGAKIVAICDNDAPRLRSGSRRVKEAKTYADADKMLTTEKGIEAVFVATPTHLHRGVVESAIAAGKHVYCEAPLAHTVEDAKAIALAARGSSKVFQAGLLAGAEAGDAHGGAPATGG